MDMVRRWFWGFVLVRQVEDGVEGMIFRDGADDLVDGGCWVRQEEVLEVVRILADAFKEGLEGMVLLGVLVEADEVLGESGMLVRVWSPLEEAGEGLLAAAFEFELGGDIAGILPDRGKGLWRMRE